jgi:hypothetical protein
MYPAVLTFEGLQHAPGVRHRILRQRRKKVLFLFAVVALLGEHAHELHQITQHLRVHCFSICQPFIGEKRHRSDYFIDGTYGRAPASR